MIDELYGSRCSCCDGGVSDSSVSVGVGIDDDLLDEILQEIYNEEVDEVSGISPTLFSVNRDYFHKAIDDGIINSANAAIDDDQEWIDALKHSADVFSLHRTANQCALLAESMVDSDGNLKSFEQFKKDTQSINKHYNQAWLRTEYDTAVLRAQMGADWKLFERDADVLPNLRWMQTTSANPREVHAVFWRNKLTLPIDDPFWSKHRPGDQWNCKCWLEQTDEEATAPADMPDSADMPEPKAGLKGNPAKTKEIFSQDHPHFPDKCATCHLNTDGKVHGTRKKVKNTGVVTIGNCFFCKEASKCIDRIDNMCDTLPTISPVISNRLKQMKSPKEQQDFLKRILNNNEAKIILSSGNAKTRMYEGCKGPTSGSWDRTKALAKALNDAGKDVTFLAEYENITCSDAIVSFKGTLILADFKCSSTEKGHNLFKDLKKGFIQADNIVLRLENMNLTQFKECVDELKRKYENKDSITYHNVKIGNMIVVNKKGELIELERKHFMNDTYLEMLKGILI